MTGLTFTRLVERGEPRDVARLLAETGRARDSEETLVRAMKDVLEIIRTSSYVETERVRRIRRVCESALERIT